MGQGNKVEPLAQAQAVIEASKKTRLHAYFVLSLLTGVRTEEARALTWDRVHLESEGDLPPHFEVWRSVRKGGDTKTRKSRRTLALPDEVVLVWPLTKNASTSSVTGRSGATCGPRMTSFSAIATASRSPRKA